jgi:hypothetical protein
MTSPDPRHRKWSRIIPGLIALGLITHVVAMVSAAVFITRRDNDRVMPDYYAKALNWDHIKAARALTDELGLRASIDVISIDARGDAIVNVTLASDLAAKVESISFSAMHVRHGLKASSTTLAPTAEGWRGVVHFDRPGIWNVELIALVNGSEAQIDTTLELTSE